MIKFRFTAYSPWTVLAVMGGVVLANIALYAALIIGVLLLVKWILF